MFNPGLIYLLGGLALYITKGKARELLALFISLVGLIAIFNLSLESSWVINFLNFDLILLEVDNISRLVGIIFAFFGLASTIYSTKNCRR